MKRYAKLKKTVACLLAIALVFAVSATALAEGGTLGGPSDPCTLTEGCVLENGHTGDCQTVSPSAQAAAVQERIDALPGAEALEAMDDAGLAAVAQEVYEIEDAIDALSEGADMLDTAKLEAVESYLAEHDGTIGYTIDPSDVCSIGDTGYATLEQAFATAADGDVITLQKNVTVSSAIAVDQKLTLNLNGFVITNRVAGDRVFNISSSEFTVDGTKAGSGMTIPADHTTSYGFFKLTTATKLTLNGGSYTGDTDNGAFIRPFNRSGMDASGSTIVLNDVTMETNKWFISTDTLLTPADVPTLQVTGGSYKTDGVGFGMDTIDASPISFKNVQAEAVQGPIIEVSGAAATFEGCDFKVTTTASDPGFFATAVAVSWGGTAEIKSGKYSSTGYGVYVYSSGGTITVKDGEVSGRIAAARADVDESSYPDAEALVDIKGGTFEGALQTNSSSSANIVVRGGTFDRDVFEFVAAGNQIEQDAEGNYVVSVDPAQVVAEIVREGEIQYYFDLQDALDDVQAGETITLKKHVALPDGTAVILSGKGTAEAPVVLDLNGFDINGSNANAVASDTSATPGGILRVASSHAVLTDTSAGVKGGIFNAAATGTTFTVWVKVDDTLKTDASLVVKNGVRMGNASTATGSAPLVNHNRVTADAKSVLTVENAELISGKGYAVWHNTKSGYPAETTINGGEFTSGKAANASIIAAAAVINGGTFYNWSTSNKAAEGKFLCLNETDGVFSATVTDAAPTDYTAHVAGTNLYLISGDLYVLQNAVSLNDQTVEVKKSTSYTLPDGKALGRTEGSPISTITLDLADGVVLTGNLNLRVIDIQVTGNGTLADSFGMTPFSSDYAMLPDTPAGTYSCRIAPQSVVAEVTEADGTISQYLNFSSAWMQAGQTAVQEKGVPTLKLLKDVTASAFVAVNSGDQINLDLNGHTYNFTGTSQAFMLYSNAALNLMDSSEAGGGKLKANAAGNLSIATYKTSRNASIEIGAGVIVEGNTVLLEGTNPKLDVYGTIDTTGTVNPAIMGNGANTTDSMITIHPGAVIKSTVLAIFHPQPGILNVEGGEISGDTGIEMRAGTLNVSGDAKITGTGSTYEVVPNGSGSTTSGAGIAISQHTTKLPVVVNITGGEVSGPVALSEANPQGNPAEAIEQVEIRISGGEFAGELKSQDIEQFISGGIFDREMDENFVNEDMQPVEKDPQRGTWSVVPRGEVKYSIDGSAWEYSDLWTAIIRCYDAQTEAEIVLLESVTLTEDNWANGLALVRDNVALTIDGQGYQITRSAGISDVATVSGSGSEVTLKDIVIDGGAVWDGDDPSTRTNTGLQYTGNIHLFTVSNNAKLILDAGATLQNSDIQSGYGAAINVDRNGVLVMHNGSSILNNAARSSAAVCLQNGTFEMNGGVISGNYSSVHAGAVYVAGDMMMNGGVIQNNVAGYVGGGGIDYSRGTLTVSGTPVVQDNIMIAANARNADNVSVNNIQIAENPKIAIAGTLEEGAMLGITTALLPTKLAPVDITEANADDQSEFFTSDHPSYAVKNSPDNIVQLAFDEFEIQLNVDGGITTLTTQLKKLSNLPVPTREDFVFRGWFDAEEGGNEITEDTVFDRDMMIYAQWLQKHTITVNNGIATDATGVEIAKAVAGTEVTITAGPAEGTFTGWTVESGGVTPADPNAESTTFIMGDEDVTLTANYHVHRFDGVWKNNANGHWKECSCGAASAIEPHTFVWVTDKDATQTEDGSKHEQCSVCGYAKAAVVIPSAGTAQSQPQTGDASQPMLWVIIAVVAAAAVICVVLLMRRRTSKNK